MKERPILFSAPMVRALLAGTKTQTRRILKQQPNPSMVTFSEPYTKLHGTQTWLLGLGNSQRITCPYGQPGDRLWVRESWRYCCAQMSPHVSAVIEYKADGSKLDIPVLVEQLPHPRPENGESHSARMRYLEKWWAMGRPSIHMPRWASRITLEITGVRVERLQDISESDAIDEGCGFLLPEYPQWDGDPDLYRKLYRVLWEQINGPGSWAANPWVWVVEFKRLTAMAKGE